MTTETPSPATETLETIQARITAQEAAHKADIAMLNEAKQAIAENQAPLLPLLSDRTLFCQRIALAKQQRDYAVQRGAEFRRELLAWVGISGDGNFNQFIEARLAHLKDAPLHQSIIDEWLTDAAVKLAAMDADILAMAKDRNLLYMLPPDIKQ